MKNDIKLRAVWPRKRLTELSQIYASSPSQFSVEYKKEIIEIAKVAGRKTVADKLAIHPATLSKWEKKLPKEMATKNPIASPNSQKPVIEGATERQRVAMVLPYLAILLPLELYLGFKCHQLAKDVFCAGNSEAIVMAILTELVPISMCFLKSNETRGWIEKSVINCCMGLSFVFSVYCVVGTELNTIVHQITDTNKTHKTQENLSNRISRINEDINYYKNAIREDGKGKGWPYRVKLLQEKKAEAQAKLDTLFSAPVKNNTVLFVNLIMLLFLRLSWQAASLIISMRMFELIKI